MVVHAFSPSTSKAELGEFWFEASLEHREFQDSQGCVDRSCLQINKQTNKQIRKKLAML